VLFDTIYEMLISFGFKEGLQFKANRSELEIKIRGKAKIYVKSAQIGDRLRGYTVADVYIDEGAYLKDNSVYEILLGRIREVSDPQIHITTTPNGYNWVYELCQKDTTELIKVSTFKNPFLSDQFIKNMLKQYTSQFIEQELNAEFVQMSSGLFRSDWFKSAATMTDTSSPKKVRFWDLAFGESKESDFSAGVLLSKVGSNYVIEDIVRVRQEYDQLKKTIIEQALQDGKDVDICLEKAGQQKAIIKDIFSESKLAHFTTKSLTVAKYGHKIKRVLPVASKAEQGFIYIKDNCRNKRELFDEVDALTFDDSHRHDDIADALASAYISLNSTQFVRGHKGAGIY
jgi:predicted phage terminase large subunit-like protein